MCCGSCAGAEIADEQEKKGLKADEVKAVYYNRQSNDAFRSKLRGANWLTPNLHSTLHLSWQGDADEIVAALREQGLTVEHDGSELRCIQVLPGGIAIDDPRFHPLDLGLWIRMIPVAWDTARAYKLPLKEIQPTPLPGGAANQSILGCCYPHLGVIHIALRFRDREGNWLGPRPEPDVWRTLAHGSRIWKSPGTRTASGRCTKTFGQTSRGERRCESGFSRSESECRHGPPGGSVARRRARVSAG